MTTFNEMLSNLTTNIYCIFYGSAGHSTELQGVTPYGVLFYLKAEAQSVEMVAWIDDEGKYPQTMFTGNHTRLECVVAEDDSDLFTWIHDFTALQRILGGFSGMLAGMNPNPVPMSEQRQAEYRNAIMQELVS